MSTKLIAKKYARALVSVAGESSAGSAQFSDGLAAIKELFTIPKAAKILRSPVMSGELKRDLLAYAIAHASGNHKSLLVFVDLLITAKRVEILPEIADFYQTILAAVRGEQHGVISSAVAMQETELAEIANKLQKIFKQQVVLENQVKPELLGGFVVRVGNTLIDQSVTSKIKALALGLQHT
jgi:F-type H+-transporting ATPase subunit delta